MIRGTTTQFKFVMPDVMTNYCVIEAIFWQPGNEGTAQAPLPITMVYDRRYTDTVSEPTGIVDFDITKVYKYDGRYYKYNNSIWEPSDTQPIRNDGLCTDENNAKEIVVTLTAEQTLRFHDTIKAYTQIVACHGVMANATVASRRQRVTVYPIYGNLNLAETMLSVSDGGLRG